MTHMRFLGTLVLAVSTASGMSLMNSSAAQETAAPRTVQASPAVVAKIAKDLGASGKPSCYKAELARADKRWGMISNRLTVNAGTAGPACPKHPISSSRGPSIVTKVGGEWKSILDWWPGGPLPCVKLQSTLVSNGAPPEVVKELTNPAALDCVK